MLVVGLTGGLGAGKSTVGRALAARGAVVIEADEVARQVIAPGSTGERAVLGHFGPGVAGPDGAIDRAALARLVFSSPPDRLALEAITHPLIRDEVARRVAAAGAAGQDVVVVELPLLNVARRQQYRLDVVVVVDAPTEVAVARAVARGMNEDDARNRLAALPTNDERHSIADRVLVNAMGLEELGAQVSELWDWLYGLRNFV